MKPRGGVAIGLVIGTLMVVLSASGLYLTTPRGTSSSTSSSSNITQAPSMVNVFGLASTVGQDTSVVSLTFTNTAAGGSYTVQVSGGRFSVDVPNGVVYHVTARWVGNYSWQAGIEDRGDLTVNMSAGSMASMSYTLQFETPPTIVAVHGTILWTIATAFPAWVDHKASDGESFPTQVQNARSTA